MHAAIQILRQLQTVPSFADALSRADGDLDAMVQAAAAHGLRVGAADFVAALAEARAQAGLQATVTAHPAVYLA